MGETRTIPWAAIISARVSHPHNNSNHFIPRFTVCFPLRDLYTSIGMAWPRSGEDAAAVWDVQNGAEGAAVERSRAARVGVRIGTRRAVSPGTNSSRDAPGGAVSRQE